MKEEIIKALLIERQKFTDDFLQCSRTYIKYDKVKSDYMEQVKYIDEQISKNIV